MSFMVFRNVFSTLSTDSYLIFYSDAYAFIFFTYNSIDLEFILYGIRCELNFIFQTS